MTLCLDIGNSAIKAGLFDGRRLARTARFEHGDGLNLHDFVGDATVAACGIASVVLDATPRAIEALASVCAAGPLVVSAEVRLPFEMAYETPTTLGADRIAAAAGARALFPGADPLVTVDAGSAVTIEVVEGNRFVGGAISPGPRLLHHALARGTAQLPDLDPQPAERSVGRSTEESIRIGVMVPFLDGLAGLLRRIRSELSGEPTIVATGGWAGLVATHLEEIDHVEPHLVLHGIRELVDLNSSA